MDETLIRALVIGAMFAAIGITASLLWKLVRSPSEGARRARLVIGIAFALVLITGFATGNASERTFIVALAFILGGGYWIAKGMKND